MLGGLTTRALSIDSGTGGGDTISGGDGNDVIIGGTGADRINGGAGRDIAVGDSGLVAFTTSGLVNSVATTNPGVGGDDTIFGDGGDDVVIGGIGNDFLSGGTGNDAIEGDNGSLIAKSVSTSVFTQATLAVTDPTLGGNDNITGDENDDIIIGGSTGDSISGGTGNDLIFGDHAEGRLAVHVALRVRLALHHGRQQRRQRPDPWRLRQ